MVNTLSSKELFSLVEKYPWFSPARAALCRRALESSGREAAVSAFNDALLYFPDAGWLAAELFRSADGDVFKDPDCAAEEYGRDGGIEGNGSGTAPADGSGPRPRLVLAGMDYFSKEDYESVKDSSLDSPLDRLGRFTDDGRQADRTPLREALPSSGCEESARADFEDMVTETLGQIYAEQGYFTEAKDIYSKLSLQSPEKSAYFASLIKELDDNSNS